MESFEDHFKHRLLFMVVGVFNGTYSSRFKGTAPYSLIGEVMEFDEMRKAAVWMDSF